MRNIKLVLEYDGTDFHGWQYQPDERTVQGDLEHALCRLMQKKIRVIGAGRTDQGVHAYGQVANFSTDSAMELLHMKKAINAMTSDDLSVRIIEEVPSDFHSRYSAQAKTYSYYLLHEPSPLRRRYAWILSHHLDTEEMRKTAHLLVGRHDFKNFAVGNGDSTGECTIRDITVEGDSQQTTIMVGGDRFLRRMIRGMVGFLYDVGRKRYQPHDTHKVFDGRLKELFFAPAHGLFLVKVHYETEKSS